MADFLNNRPFCSIDLMTTSEHVRKAGDQPTCVVRHTMRAISHILADVLTVMALSSGSLHLVVVKRALHFLNRKMRRITPSLCKEIA